MFACVFLLVGMFVVSGTELTFQYQPLRSCRRSNEPCKVCYGEDCLEIDQTRCEYYIETDPILHDEELAGEEEPVVRAEVDRLLHTYMENASAIHTECIPFVSAYTNCTKENICTGCNTCHCDGNGRWNCSVTHKCRPDVPVEVDHRMLVMVMENLANGPHYTREKREIQENLETTKSNTNKMSYDEILRWMYGDEVVVNTKEANIHNTHYGNQAIATTNAETITQKAIYNIDTNTNVDYLAFDEVLNSIAVDTKNYTRRKPLDIVHNDSVAFDYMLFDEDGSDNVTDVAEVKNLDTTYSPINTGDGETEIVIDLLETAKKNVGETFTANWTDYTEPDSKINIIQPTLDYIDNFILGSKSIVKRDLMQTEKENKEENVSNNIIELRDNVLLPLSNIINDKQKELEELLRVSENLINIMRSYKNQTIVANTLKNKNEEKNPSISIYNFEVTSELENDFRRSGKNLLDKYLIKLKRDIYEVIRDIAGIHKIKGTANIPQDLKILIRAMKHYVRNQTKLKSKGNKTDSAGAKNRRKYNKDNSGTQKQSAINELVNILKVLDKNMPEGNTLAPLSPTSKKIVSRIIKNNYVDEFTVVGLRIFDPKYNFTTDLENIGNEWPRLTNNIAQTSIHNRLYAMKLLHLILSIDISKMNDALNLLEFAYNRRMILIEGSMRGKIIDKINKGLKAINEKIKVIIKLHSKNRQVNKVEATKKNQKKSFIRKLKNILKTSKNDIVNLLKRKVPKKDIVKELAKKKIDDLTRRRFQDFENTMKKWQNNLNLVPRDKRFAGDVNYKNRMKNIIPKYLRGKVNPAINANKSKKSKKHGKQKSHSKSTTPSLKSNSTSTKSKLNGL